METHQLHLLRRDQRRIRRDTFRRKLRETNAPLRRLTVFGVQLREIDLTVAAKVVGKLLTEGLLEEIQASGSLPVWRRDESEGPIALRITKRGLRAIQVSIGVGLGL